MKYHRDVYFPPELSRFYRRGIITLKWSSHALEAAKRDRYGNIPVFHTIDTEAVIPIEVEFRDGRYHKTLYRIPGESIDICVAVMYNGNVKTVWYNEKNDSHNTLCKSEYVGC